MLIEKEGRSAEEAIERICEELGKERDELEFEVVGEKPRGILGLMGNKRVRVRARLKGESGTGEAAAEDALSLAKGVLERILSGISVPFEVNGRRDGGVIYLDIKGDGSGILIGRHGQTLDAIQYIVERIVRRQLGERQVITIDVEGYRQRRREGLERLCRQMGEKAKNTGKAVTLPPMNARDRRIVHLALKQDQDLETRSEGEGAFRCIKIIPRKRGG